MTELHKSLLEILVAFDELCRSHDIQYSLHGGTLLGAIREHGFIPWDDDADVTMTRANFKRLEAALHGAETKYYIRGHIKKQFCEISNPNVWVDIFICDYISERKVAQKLKQLLLTVLDIMYRDKESRKLSNLEKYGLTKQLMYEAAFFLGQIFPKQWIAHAYNKIAERWLLGNRKNMFRSNDQYLGREQVFPAARMAYCQHVNFESTILPVSTEWHSFLLQLYGKTYMTPVREERNIQVHELIRSDQRIKM